MMNYPCDGELERGQCNDFRKRSLKKGGIKVDGERGCPFCRLLTESYCVGEEVSEIHHHSITVTSLAVLKWMNDLLFFPFQTLKCIRPQLIYIAYYGSRKITTEVYCTLRLLGVQVDSWLILATETRILNKRFALRGGHLVVLRHCMGETELMGGKDNRWSCLLLWHRRSLYTYILMPKA